MRTAFIEALEALAAKNKNIVLLNGDLGFSVLENFTKKYPDRSLNMGVAEANMMGVAAGLALSGKTVFVYSIIPFVTARVYEQVRNDVSIQNANVKIVGVGSGLVYGQLGPTHHSVEDIALMRTLPGMTVFAPADPVETRLATAAAVKIKGPVYMRIAKKGDALVHLRSPKFIPGKGIVVAQGKDAAILATGNMVIVACEARERLIKKGIHVRVISMHTLKPLDESLVVKTAKEIKNIFTLEEHSIIGGLGSAVAEVLVEKGIHLKIFARLGIRDRVTFRSGSHESLRKYHRLSSEEIAKKIEQLLKKRQY